MIIVALTGGIGSGKTTVAQFFNELGATVVDADQLARIAIAKKSAGFDRVVERFGQSVLSNGGIDRKALALIIFSDPQARKDLEAIVHPEVRRLFKQAVSDADQSIPFIYEVPLLVESDGAAHFDFIITVEADIEIRRERLLKRGMSAEDIEARMANQASPESRIGIAHAVIRNDGDDDELLRQVENLLDGPLSDLSAERAR